MAKYKLTESGVLDTETGTSIPNAPGNRHWQEYQEWLSEGNTPDPQYTLDEWKTGKKAEVRANSNSRIFNDVSTKVLIRIALLQQKQIEGTLLTQDEQDDLADGLADLEARIQDEIDALAEEARIDDLTEIEAAREIRQK